MIKKIIFAAAAFGLFQTVLYCETPEVRSEIPLAFKVGESLVFNVNWGVINAGEGTLSVQEMIDLVVDTETQRTVPTYHFVAVAKSNSVLDVFYKVRDKNESWLDVQKWVSHRFEQHNQEGKYILDQRVDFNWEKKRFHNTENVKGRLPKEESGDLTIPAVDTLASLYLVRGKELKVGDELTIDVHSGRNWPLVLKVLKKETVKVPAGKFECYKVEPFLKERGIFIQKGKKLQVWLTADERKMPVKMTAEIFIGHVSAELREIH